MNDQELNSRIMARLKSQDSTIPDTSPAPTPEIPRAPKRNRRKRKKGST